MPYFLFASFGTRLIFLLILTSMVYLSGVIYRNSAGYYRLEVTENTAHFHEMPENIDIAVFGASHGRDALLFAPEGKSLFNFSMSSQTPQYDEMQMLEYGNRFHRGTLVILTVSYLSPFWTDSEENFLKKQGRYYRILSPEHIVDVDKTKYWMQKFSPLLTENADSLLSSILASQTEETDRENVPIFLPEEMEAERQRIRKNHYNVIEPAFPDGNPVMLTALQSMLNICEQQGWTAILLTPPYTDAYNELFSEQNFPGFYEAFYEKIAELTEEFQIPWMDYSHDPRMSGEYGYFKNIDHLNENGAAVFDDILFDDLAEMKIFMTIPKISTDNRLYETSSSNLPKSPDP